MSKWFAPLSRQNQSFCDLIVYIDRGKSKKSGLTTHPQRKKQNYGGHDYSSDSNSDGDESFTNIKHVEGNDNKDRKAEGLKTGISCPIINKEASTLNEGTFMYKA